jgi:hypothetical protein
MVRPGIRLIATPEQDPSQVRFLASFAAPASDAEAPCSPAQLLPGDGRVLELGPLCAPTVPTWREQRRVDLGTCRYEGSGPFAAQLHWGPSIAQASVTVGRAPLPSAPVSRPDLVAFSVDPVRDTPMQWRVTVRVRKLGRDQILRLDGGNGEAPSLGGQHGEAQEGSWILTYVKAGVYTIAADLLDGEGFWLASLGNKLVEAAPPGEREPLVYAEVATQPVRGPVLPGAEPWMPFRYARPRRGGVRTFTAPGSGKVRRTVGGGTYFSIRNEALHGGGIWYQTGSSDWVLSENVTLFNPSTLHGAVLGGSATPPPPPAPAPPSPPPAGGRSGIVTATVLNIRARPGVSSSNPPIGKLTGGAEIPIYEQVTHAGATWYRIGVNRWVHSGYVRLTDARRAIYETRSAGNGDGQRRGVVTSATLNVRALPGLRADNPPFESLPAGIEVPLLEEYAEGETLWYRIGDSRWVHGGFLRVLEGNGRAAKADPAAEQTGPVRLPVGWVVPQTLDVHRGPGAGSDNPAIQQLPHNQLLAILEEKVADGARWYRVGNDQWVDGRSVGVARYKARPAGIRPNELWVGVSLQEQTLVAYAGDQPVFAALISSGTAATPTVRGIFRTWLRRDTGKMSGGGGASYYYIEDVTWTSFFYQGYALHTAYWHDSFGKTRSHGCVNLSPHDAWWIHKWSAAGGPKSPAVYVYGA